MCQVTYDDCVMRKAVAAVRPNPYFFLLDFFLALIIVNRMRQD